MHDYNHLWRAAASTAWLAPLPDQLSRGVERLFRLRYKPVDDLTPWRLHSTFISPTFIKYPTGLLEIDPK